MASVEKGPYRIHEWSDVEHQFGDTIVLGNGASIAIDQRFSYRDIFDMAGRHGFISEDENRIFQEYQTTSFERVLEALRHAERVSSALMFDESSLEVIRERTKKVKQALRDTVAEIHAERKDVSKYFPRIADFLTHFGRVFSLNYDLIVYWSLLWAHGVPNRPDRMMDCFSYDADDGLVFRRNVPLNTNGRNLTVVLYPHGNFALAKERTDERLGKEIKITAYSRNVTLLDSIVKHWMSDEYDPLIVSEGSTFQKTDAISRSDYLRTVVFNELRNVKESVVFYGFGFRDNDSHIIENVFRSPENIDRVGVSVYFGDKSDGKLIDYCKSAKNKIKSAYRKGEGHSSPPDITFFDSSSDGAWIYKNEETSQDDIPVETESEYEPDDELPF